MKRTPKPTSERSLVVKHFSALKKPSKAHMARLLKRSRGAIDTSDIPDLADAADEARRIVRRAPVAQKVSVTIRLDADLVEWFKSQGEGYQTRINEVLREYRATEGTDDDGVATIDHIKALLDKVGRRLAS